MTKSSIPPTGANPPKNGEVYRHYKGNLYEIFSLAIHSNEDIWMVVYRPLYECALAEYFTRPLSDWREAVEWEREKVQRFTLVENN